MIIKSLGCRIGWHDWNKYGEVVSAYGGLTQFRSCKKCNKIDYVKCYGNQAKSQDVNRTVNAVTITNNKKQANNR